jgi:hypothetical protein
MVSLYLIKCHKILDKQKEVREAVVHADFFRDVIRFVEFIELKVSKILMFVTNGDQDILKGNGTNNS